MIAYTGPETGTIPGLNALRFFGALSVIFLHIGSLDYFEQLGILKYHRLVHGATGVMLFYVISGFLITALAMDEIRRNGYFNYLKFLQRRSLRLFPLYYFALFVIFLFSLAGLTKVSGTGWLYAATYAFNYVPREHYNGLLGSFHTLATEEQFYLFFGGTLFAIFALKKGAMISWKFAVLAALLFFALYVNSLFIGLDWVQQYKDTHFIHRWLPNAMAPILIGCLFALSVKSHAARVAMQHISKNSRVSTALFVFSLFIGSYLYFSYIYHDSDILLSVGFGTIISTLYFFRTNVISAIIDFPILSYLGKISYGLYVWQAVINGTGSSSRVIESTYVSTALVFFVSVLSYELFEKRFLRLKKYA